MKKFFLFFVLSLFLSGCTIVREAKDLNEEEKANIKQQIIDELKEELANKYRNDLTEVEKSIIDLYEHEAKAVLGVSNYAFIDGVKKVQGTGSGVVYKKDGNNYYLITNEHVIRGSEQVRVVFADLSTLEAEVIGFDQITDIAVLRIVTSDYLPVVNFKDTSELVPGQFAVAVGNPLGYDYYRSITIGIVSGVSRRVDVDYDEDNVIDWKATLIQHDAAISPGNSGGALFDIFGNLIGINNMKIVSSDVSGIGFAIPVSIIKPIIEQLETNGRVIRPSLGIVGIEVENLIGSTEYNIPDGITSGIYITDVVPNSSVSGRDVKPNDILIKINGDEVSVIEDIRLLLNEFSIGETITLTLLRNGEPIQVDIVLKERPN